LSNPPANLLRFDYWQLTPLNLYAVTAVFLSQTNWQLQPNALPQQFLPAAVAATERNSPRPYHHLNAKETGCSQ
jgi:hypothetical protein